MELVQINLICFVKIIIINGNIIAFYVVIFQFFPFGSGFGSRKEN